MFIFFEALILRVVAGYPFRLWQLIALIEALQRDFAYIMRLLVNLFIRQVYLACKQHNQYRKPNYKKGVVSLIRNTVVTLTPEWMVTLNRNQVVSFSEISTYAINFKSASLKASGCSIFEI